MEHNREPRNKPADIWWIDFQQENQEYIMGKEQSPQQMMFGKLDIHMQKNKMKLLSYTIVKNQLKMD